MSIKSLISCTSCNRFTKGKGRVPQDIDIQKRYRPWFGIGLRIAALGNLLLKTKQLGSKLYRIGQFYQTGEKKSVQLQVHNVLKSFHSLI